MYRSPWPKAASASALRGGVGARQLALVLHHAHAAPAAAGHRLEQHRVADLARQILGLLDAAQRALRAGDHRHPGRAHGLAGDRLVAHQADGLGRRADEGQLALGADLGEVGVFGEKAVAGVDRVAAGDQRGGDQRRRVEIRARLLAETMATGRSAIPPAYAVDRDTRRPTPI